VIEQLRTANEELGSSHKRCAKRSALPFHSRHRAGSHHHHRRTRLIESFSPAAARLFGYAPDE
jgi:hypothetical protein